MYKSGEFVKKYVSSSQFDEKTQVQPNGVDLTIGDIKNVLAGRMIDNKKEVYDASTATFVDNGMTFYLLRTGAYIVRYFERVKVPDGYVGVVFPRSSLMRMGGMLYTALWDTGYEGVGQGLLVAHATLELGFNERIGQFCLVEAESNKKYNGQYQHEGLKAEPLDKFFEPSDSHC